VLAGGEKLRERVLGAADRIGPRQRDRVEAERMRLLGEGRFQRRRIAQKSRSA
jgi:hypothetical protein